MKKILKLFGLTFLILSLLLFSACFTKKDLTEYHTLISTNKVLMLEFAEKLAPCLSYAGTEDEVSKITDLIIDNEALLNSINNNDKSITKLKDKLVDTDYYEIVIEVYWAYAEYYDAISIEYRNYTASAPYMINVNEKLTALNTQLKTLSEMINE